MQLACTNLQVARQPCTIGGRCSGCGPPSKRRYPSGESYLDVIQRLEPVIIEIERERECVCVVAHQAILRALYGYFMKVGPPLAIRRATLLREKTPLLVTRLEVTGLLGDRAAHQVETVCAFSARGTGDVPTPCALCCAGPPGGEASAIMPTAWIPPVPYTPLHPHGHPGLGPLSVPANHTCCTIALTTWQPSTCVRYVDRTSRVWTCRCTL